MGTTTVSRIFARASNSGAGAQFALLVLHDDTQREYACGPAEGLRGTRIGTVSQALYDEAKGSSGTVISAKDDWKRVFAPG